MIRHIVLVSVAQDTQDETIAEIFSGLAALVEAIPGARNFAGGRSRSPENLERGYTHGFTIDFESWDDLRTYADHPEHVDLGSRLLSHAKGGADGLIVLDVETGERSR